MPTSPRSRRTRLFLSPLEGRAVPASFTVTNPTDAPVADKLNLRQALAAADANGEDDTINIDSDLKGMTLTLTGGELKITEGKKLDIGSSDPFTISGNDLSRVFNVSAGAEVSITGLTLTKGRPPPAAGRSSTPASSALADRP
jgi:hypothetical protein